MNRIAAFTLGLVVCGLGVSSSLAAQPVLPPGCSEADPESCLYVSDQRYEVGVADNITLTDAARHNLSVPLLVHYPKGAAGPRPVVIWHHGGNLSARGKTRSAEWGTVLAAAGYVVVHPSRVLLTDPSPYRSECSSNGYPTAPGCAQWVSQMRFGPQNTHFLIDHLADLANANPALNGLLDSTKVIVGGHSAGSAAVLANAGGGQQWKTGGPVYREIDTRPIAFLASGPQGPAYAGFSTGFQPDSFKAIDTRPLLLISGFGDETGEPAVARTTAFLSARQGAKWLSWDTAPSAVHETMDIHQCDTPLREDHCRWLGALGVAYLDAVVRGRAEAVEWLESGALEVLSSGVIELHAR